MYRKNLKKSGFFEKKIKKSEKKALFAISPPHGSRYARNFTPDTQERRIKEGLRL
jgi:hypothetical protein